MTAKKSDTQILVDKLVDAHQVQGPRYQVTRSLWWTPYSRLNRAGRVAKRRAKARAGARRRVEKHMGTS